MPGGKSTKQSGSGKNDKAPSKDNDASKSPIPEKLLTSIKENKDLDNLIEKLYACEYLKEQNVTLLCTKAKALLEKEPNMISVSPPVTIVGDIHGQHFDMMEMFQMAGKCPDTNFLFLGDYVDRGAFSVETISLLVCLKLRYPKRINLLRGNHECRQVTRVYGFYDEVMRKYKSAHVWSLFTDLFDFFPIAALVKDKIFCMHGGMSPSLDTLGHVKLIEHTQEVPQEGPLCDLLWSDPMDDTMATNEGYGISPRGAGYTWGADISAKFCERNNLKMICRAHQLVMDGFTWSHTKKCLTIFSAPNYCYRCGNLAGFMTVNDDMSTKMFTFEAVERTENFDPFGGKTPPPEFFS